MKRLYSVAVLLLLAAVCSAGTVTFTQREVLTSTKLNSALNEKLDSIAHSAYSSATQGKLNAKASIAALGTYSTATQTKLNAKADTSDLTTINTRFSAYTSLGIPLATTIDATGTTTFPTAATIYNTYSSTVRKAGTAGGGSFASITGQPTDNTNLATALNAKASTSYVDAAIAGVTAGSLPSVSSDPSAPAAGYTWYNTTDHTLNVAQASGRTKFSGTYTAWDTTPDAFSFLDETGIAVLTTKTSAPVTIAGIDYPAAISVTGDTGYGYSKNSAACTATSGTVVAGDTVAACVTSSASGNTATTATVTVGGVSDTYSVTTMVTGLSDDFTGADGTNIVAHDSNWVESAFSGHTGLTASVTLNSNTARIGTYKEAGGYYTGSVGSESQITAIAYSTNSMAIKPAVRMGSTSMGYTVEFNNSSGGNWTDAVVKRNGTFLATLSGLTISQASNHVMKITASGTSPVVVTAFVDGTQIGQYTDSTSPIASGYSGFVMKNNLGTAYNLGDTWSGI